MDMARNAYHYSLVVSVAFLLIIVEQFTPPAAAARKLLLDESDTGDGGQQKIGANGSDSRHAGSATGKNDTLPSSLKLSPPTAFNFYGSTPNGTSHVSVTYQLYVPPGTPTSIDVSVTYPNGHPHPAPPPGSSEDAPGRIVPSPDFHWHSP